MRRTWALFGSGGNRRMTWIGAEKGREDAALFCYRLHRYNVSPNRNVRKEDAKNRRENPVRLLLRLLCGFAVEKI